jgi:penicillin amidase
MRSVNWRRVLIGGVTSFVLLIVLFAVFAVHLVTRSFPDVDGTIGAPGLGAPVHVSRDLYGIPHIDASSSDDAWYAVGYLHAQDRLFQMDLARRAGQGRLSEIFGTRALPVDALFRTVGIAHIAARCYATLPAETRRDLESYSRGINAYLDGHRSRLPVEFDALNYKPDAWEPVHCVIMERMMAWELNFAWWMDIVTADAFEHVGPKLGAELFPQYPPDAPTVLREERTVSASQPTVGGARRTVLEESVREDLHAMANAESVFHDLLGTSHREGGSNAWAVAPWRSASGRPIVCSDPHLFYSAPARWYQMHVHTPLFNLAGVSLPGIPYIIIGRNNALAWGSTNAMADDCDFVVETLDSGNQSAYLSHGAYRSFTITIDTLHPRDTLAVPLHVMESEHGPIVSDVHLLNHAGIVFHDNIPSVQRPLFKRSAVAMRWMGSAVSDELSAIRRLNLCTSAAGVPDAVASYAVPAQNLVYADTAGHIGYILQGHIPLRNTPYPGLSVPVPAGADDQIWSSTLPVAQNPRFLDPKTGFVASANNPSTNVPFVPYFTNQWEPPSRAQRIVQIFEGKQGIGIDNMRRAQNDNISPHALDAARYILAAYPDSVSQQLLVRQSLTYLANWDGSMNKEEIGASVFNMWLVKMFDRLFHPRLGDEAYREYLLLNSLPHRALTQLLRTPSSDWWDDVRTQGRETRDECIRAALIDALRELTDRFGSTEMKRWQWGALHTIEIRHRLGRGTPFDRVVNVGPFPAGGSLTTINNGQFDLVHPFDGELGASMRMIADLSTKKILSILPTGVSGQPFHTHYADQNALYRNAGYVEITMDPAEIPQPGWTTVTMQP